MEKLFELIKNKPELYKQSKNIWVDSHLSKGMLEAHLDTEFEGATRRLKFVEESIKWITSIASCESHHRLLDLGCGPGIYCERFRKQGYEVVGLDISKRSIDYATDSAIKQNLNIRYIQGDYTNYKFDERVDLVTMIYCDFGVLAPDTRVNLLKKVHHALDEGGVFIFDVFTKEQYTSKPEFKKWSFNESGFWCKEEHLLLHAFYRYEEENTFLNEYIIVQEGDKNIESYMVWEHVFTEEEIRNDLLKAGFSSCIFYNNLCGESYTGKGNTMAIVARK